MTTVVMSVGLIEGRHPLPVERYLLTGPVDASPAATRETWGQVQAAVQRLLNDLDASGTSEVQLYLTGLTRAALLAVNLLCRDWLAHDPGGDRPGRLLTLVEYDATTGAYLPTLFAAWPGELLLPVPVQPPA